MVLHVVDVVLGCTAVAVDALRLCLHEDVLLVGRHQVSVDAFQLNAVPDVIDVEEHARLLSRPKAMADDALAVGRELAVALAVEEGRHPMNAFSRIRPARQVAERQLVCLYIGNCAKKHKKCHDSIHHKLRI